MLPTGSSQVPASAGQMLGKAQALLSYPIFQHLVNWLVLLLLERPSAKVLLEHLRDAEWNYKEFFTIFPCPFLRVSLALGRQETYPSSLSHDPGGIWV